MITIIKDNDELKCSQNTYDTMYKRLGYTIKEQTKQKETKETKVTKETVSKEKVVTPKTTNKGRVTKTKNKKGE